MPPLCLLAIILLCPLLGGVDYYALSATYSPFFNPVASCSTIRTKVNDNKDTPRSFIFGFDPQQANNHTVFRRYFVTVEIMDGE